MSSHVGKQHRGQVSLPSLTSQRAPADALVMAFGSGPGLALSTCVLACVPLCVRGRVLLRVRMLYYLKAEVLGEAADKAFEGTPAR